MRFPCFPPLDSQAARAADPAFDPASLELRDCGFVRPKVLILVPFRDSALKIVNIFVDAFIAKPAKETVAKKAKFLVDYGPRDKETKKVIGTDVGWN